MFGIEDEKLSNLNFGNFLKGLEIISFFSPLINEGKIAEEDYFRCQDIINQVMKPNIKAPISKYQLDQEENEIDSMISLIEESREGNEMQKEIEKMEKDLIFLHQTNSKNISKFIFSLKKIKRPFSDRIFDTCKKGKEEEI